jgi:3-oxoacyl-[acyl-carrier-protein] synthase-3
VSGNSIYHFTNTAILSVEAIEAPEVITSSSFDDQLEPTLERLGLRRGMLEQVAGIKERRWWPPEVTYSEAAAQAGAKALEAAGVSPDDIGLLIDTSVCRARLEPSSAVFVHNELGLPPSCLNFDLSNACLGFVNGMHLAGMMIDSGQIDYALIVDAEGSRTIQERTIARLQDPSTEATDILSDFATLTLGSGAAGMVLGRADRNPQGHVLVGGVGRAVTEHNQLCLGDMERMVTDSRGLLIAGLDVAEVAMKEADLEFEWDDIDHYIIHQVSTVHCDALVQRLGLDASKVPLTFPTLGNIGPAAIPITLAMHQDKIERGDKVLVMGMGSGINAMAAEIRW